MVRTRVFRLALPTIAFGLALLSCGGGDDLTLPSEGLPTAIVVIGGDGQTGVVGQPLADSLEVRVTDARDRPVQNQAVAFVPVAGGLGADLVPDTAHTNADGRAQARWVLGTVAGQQRVEARVVATGTATTLKANVTATALAGQADTVFVAKGAAQVGTVGSLLNDSLAVLVTDRFGNPIAGRQVTWSVPAGQGSVSAAATTTGADGRAAVARVLGPSSGTQTATATATGLKGSPVTFTHTATAGGAVALVKVWGDGQSAPAGFQLTDSVVVQAQDGSGNGVPGVTVLWVVATGGGSVTQQSSVTDAQGFAYTFWTLGAIAGNNTLTAGAAGLPQVSFTATGTSAQPTRIQSNSTISQNGTAGLPVTVPPSVRVTDQNSNPVPGVSVTFLVGQGGGSVSDGTASGPSVSIATNAQGVATLTAWTLGAVAGANSLTATAQGSGITGNPVSFTATGLVGPAAIITKTAGDGQTATVGTAVATAPQVKVTDQFGNAVLGAPVTFAVTAGGGAVAPAGAVGTNANGLASATSWTLGTTAGANTLTASVPNLTPANFTATGTAGAAARLAFVTAPPVSAQSGVPLTPQPVVRVTDNFGNPVTQSGLTVTAALASGTGTLAGNSAVTDAQGVATFSGLAITGGAGNYSLSFDAGLSGGALTSGTIVLGAGAATQLVVSRQPSPAAQSGIAITTQPLVQLQDANGNAVGQANVTVTAQVATGPAGAVLANATAVTNSNGLATFSGLTITGTVGSYTLQFTAGNLTPALSNGITLNAGPASDITLTVQPPPSASSGVAFQPNPVVQLRDASGNAVSQSGLTILASIATGPAGATLAGGSAVTGSTGAATFTNLRITGPAGPYTLHFVSPLLNDTVTSGTVTLGAGAAAKLAVVTQPSASVVNGAVFPQQPVIQLQDASGNPVSTSGVAVLTQVLSGSALLGGTLTVQTNGSGQAVFTDLRLTGTVGSNTLIFSAAGFTSVSSSAIDLTPGPASALTLATQPSATAQSGVPLVTQPVAQLRDQSGNLVSQAGVNVTAQIASGGGSLGGTTTVPTNGSGQAVFTDLAISGTIGTRTLGFSGTGLSGVTSNGIVVSAGPAASISMSTGNNQTATVGTAVSVAPAVLVTDLSGNPVSGVAVTFAPAPGSGSVTGSPANTNASGIAAVGSWTLGNTAGTNTLTASATGLTGSPVSFTATGLAGQAASIALNAGDGQQATVNTSVTTPPSVIVRDAFGNPVGGVAVTFTVAGGGGSVVGPSATSNASGIATVGGWTLGVVAGTNTLSASSLGLTGSPVTFTATGTPGPASAAQSTANVPANGTAGSVTTITIQARDQFGNLLTTGGASFAVNVTGANTATPSVVDNGNGTYSASYTPTFTGTDNIAISLGATPISGSPFTSVVGPGGAAAVAANSVTTQSAVVGTAVAAPPSVKVTDAGGNPVAGVSVTFAVTGGGGTVLPATAVSTDVNGIATATSWTVGTAVGSNTLTATVAGSGISGNPVAFSATGLAGPVNAAQSTANVPASGTAGSPTAIAIQARDQFGNPLTTGGANFVVDVTGANTATPTVVDNGNGTYSASYTPTVAGTDNIAITLNASPISGSPFTSTIAAGGAASIAVSAGDNQSATVNTAVATAPSVVVRDALNNPVAGVNVTFAVTGGGGSVNPTTAVTTGPNGVASVISWTLGTTAGTNTLSATAAVASGSPVVFTATGTAGPVSAAQSTASVPGTGSAGSPTAITVQARDQFGNPLTGGGATVVVTVTGANAATPAVLDNNDGTYSASYTLTVAGTDNIAITLNGSPISGSPFTSTVSAGAPVQLAFGTQPTNAKAGQNITPPPTVRVLDAFGNLVITSSVSITVAIGTDPVGGSVLSGTLTRTSSNGTASFNGLSINQVGDGFTLTATATGLTQAVSSAFNIVP